MPAEKLGYPPPVVQSMILADNVHRDPTTNKKFILGTYNTINAAQFPYTIPRFCLYLAITNGHGSTRLRVRLVDVDEQQTPIHEIAYPVNMADPNMTYETVFTFPVIFPSPGDYRVQLLVGNELLRELRLRVLQSRPSAAPSGGAEES